MSHFIYNRTALFCTVKYQLYQCLYISNLTAQDAICTVIVSRLVYLIFSALSLIYICIPGPAFFSKSNLT